MILLKIFGIILVIALALSIFQILWIIIPIAMLVLYLKNGKKKYSKKKIIGAGAACFISLLVFASSPSSSESEIPSVPAESMSVSSSQSEMDVRSSQELSSAEESSEEQSEPEPESEPPVIPANTLNLSLPQFKERFNANLAALGSTNKLSDVIWDEIEIATTGMINDNLGFTFEMSPDTKQIASLIFIGFGDGTAESGVDVMLAMSAVISAVDPDIKQGDTGALILDMLDEESEDNKIINGIRYSALMADGLGTWLTIEPDRSESQDSSNEFSQSPELESSEVVESVSQSSMIESSEPSSTPSQSVAPQTQSRQVYYTKSGEKYHYQNPCGRGTYYPCTLDEALAMGLDPCEKCVG